MQQKQQEGSGSKKSTDELISNMDSVNTELQAVVERLAKLNDVCVAKAMKCEERSVRLSSLGTSSRRLCPFCLRVRCCDGSDRSLSHHPAA